MIIPERNMKDLIDVPAEVKDEIEIIPVKRMDEVLVHALTDVPEGVVQLLEAEKKKRAARAAAEDTADDAPAPPA